MQADLNLDLCDGLRLRTLVSDDAALLAEATSGETEPSLWGPRTVGPYSLSDAHAALAAWDPAAGGQFSLGVLDGQQLIGAVGLMPDQPGSAELAYWTRPEQRGRGIASRAVRAVTPWAHRSLVIPGSGWRLSPATSHRFGSPSGPAITSNGVSPSTAATGQPKMPATTHGMTASSGPI